MEFRWADFDGFHHVLQKQRAFSGLSLGSCFNPDGDPAGEEKISTLLNRELDRRSSSGRRIRNSKDFANEFVVTKGLSQTAVSRLKNLEGLPSLLLNVTGRRKRLSESDKRRRNPAVNEEAHDEETKRVVFVWEDDSEEEEESSSLCIGSRVSSRWSPNSGRHSFDDEPSLDSHFRDIKVDPVSTLRSHRTVSKSLDFGGGKRSDGSYSPPPLRKDRLLLEPGYFPGGPVVDFKPTSHGKEKDSFFDHEESSPDEARETGTATTTTTTTKSSGFKMPPRRSSSWIRYPFPGMMMDRKCDSSELTDRFRELEIVDRETPDKTRIGSDVLPLLGTSSSGGWKVSKTHRTSSSRSRSRRSRRRVVALNEPSHPGTVSKFKLLPTPRKKVYRPSEIDEVANSSALFELKMEANVKDFFKPKRVVTIQSAAAVGNPVSSSPRRNHPMPYSESDDDREDSCNQDVAAAEGRLPPSSQSHSTTSLETSRDVENVEFDVKSKLVGDQYPEHSGVFPSKERVIWLLSKDLSLKCEGWEYSYVLKVLSQSGMEEESSPNGPLNPSLFDNIEKKYGEETARLRSERMFIFDCINSAIAEASGGGQHVGDAWGGDSRRREADAIGREIEASVTDALVNEFVFEWKRIAVVPTRRPHGGNEMSRIVGRA
ncbi:hypothetical protein M569_07480 [Genlisea aurea]|uniref:DUF4378 domain-containing protein n=1 Tax=Genlisea aurea TaxID=192259 RepID=S8CQY4_9LAMI|nr:hypothetical protein M569_07480 [Genlisea aurea]